MDAAPPLVSSVPGSAAGIALGRADLLTKGASELANVLSDFAEFVLRSHRRSRYWWEPPFDIRQQGERALHLAGEPTTTRCGEVRPREHGGTATRQRVGDERTA
jgi:hypothetical protein